MQRESLYVISHWGQDRFVWATSAAEARAKLTAPPPPFPSVTQAYPAASASARAGYGAQHMRGAATAEG